MRSNGLDGDNGRRARRQVRMAGGASVEEPRNDMENSQWRPEKSNNGQRWRGSGRAFARRTRARWALAVAALSRVGEENEREMNVER